MSAPKLLKMLTGEWKGTYRLWMSPDEPSGESESIASIAPAAMGKFMNLQYNWATDGKPHAGVLLIGHEKKDSSVKAVWIDSWHTGDKFMLCEGSSDDAGMINMLSSYPAPPGPDWGWRTVIEPQADNAFKLIMYNISPDGLEELAVEVHYTRP